MADIRRLLTKAVRSVLVADSTLIGLVSASNIVSAFTPKATAYPRIVLGREVAQGNDFSNSASGILRIRAYVQTQKPDEALSAIYNRIRTLLNMQELTVSDDDISVHDMREVYVSDTTPEIELPSDTYSLTAHYEVSVQEK